MTELEYSEFLKSETDLEREADILALEHYGVKGMKWGIRKDRTSSPRHTGKAKTKTAYRSELEKVKADRKKAYANRQLLSEKELSDRIKRLEMEKRFRDLSESDLHPGRAMIKEILGVAGPQAMKTMASGSLLYAAKVGMTKQFSWRDAADYIAPKPKKK